MVVGLDDLVDPTRRKTRRLLIQGVELDVPYFDVEGLFLWGATAMGMADFVSRLERVAGPAR